MNKFRYWLANMISGGEMQRISSRERCWVNLSAAWAEDAKECDEEIRKANVERDKWRNRAVDCRLGLVQIRNATVNVKNGTGRKVHKMCKEALAND